MSADAPEKPADPREAWWTVPSGIKTIHAEIYDADGHFITSYTLSDYLTLKAGQKLRVVAR